MTTNASSSARERSLRMLWLLIPLLQLGYQISAKEIGGAFDEHVPFWLALKDVLFTPWLALLVGCELASLFIWTFVLSALRLSAAFPMTAIGYVLVIIAGSLIFGETIDALAFAGSIIILMGVWLIGQEEAAS